MVNPLVSKLIGLGGISNIVGGVKGGTVEGVVGCVFSITSLIFIFGLDYSEVFIFPTLAVTFPDVVL